VLFMRRKEKLSEEQKAYLGRLCASDAALSDARRLTRSLRGWSATWKAGSSTGGWKKPKRRRPRS
jgi:hypothetical protein